MPAGKPIKCPGCKTVQVKLCNGMLEQLEKTIAEKKSKTKRGASKQGVILCWLREFLELKKAG